MFTVDGSKFDHLLTELQILCQERHATVATAESCTGGLIGALLSHQSGSSQHFLGGIIAYSNELKVEILQVPRELIDQHGAVSREVALSMAEGARLLTKAKFGLSVTGVAGPTGGSAEKPVGTVWCAWASASEQEAKRFLFEGTREEVRTQTALEALKGLLTLIRKNL